MNWPKANEYMTMRTSKLTAIAFCMAAILLQAVPGAAQTYTLAPTPFQTALDDSGKIIVNGCVWTYAAGTSNAISTYSNNAGALNNNPIIADYAGRFTVYLLAGVNYKFVYETACAPPAHGTTTRTQDNIAGLPAAAANVDITTAVAGEAISTGQCAYLSDGSGAKTAGQWFKCDSTNTYSSSLPEVGMAIGSIASAGTGTIRLIGLVTGLSSLSVGAEYFVSTAGAITSTAPTNRRHLGHADTATSLVLTGDPSISGLTVGQGGTGAATLTAHGVLIGEGTSAIVVTTPGTTGQILTGVTGADPTFQAPAVQTWKLLKQGSGTNAAGVATTVDSIAITGLTAKDTLVVYYVIESVTADTALTYLQNTTDGVTIAALCTAGGVVTAGASFIGQAQIMLRQGGGTAVAGTARGFNTLTNAAADDGRRAGFTQNYTGSWTLGLRHNGVTATGTFSFVWAVYQVAGQ